MAASLDRLSRCQRQRSRNITGIPILFIYSLNTFKSLESPVPRKHYLPLNFSVYRYIRSRPKRNPAPSGWPVPKVSLRTGTGRRSACIPHEPCRIPLICERDEPMINVRIFFLSSTILCLFPFGEGCTLPFSSSRPDPKLFPGQKMVRTVIIICRRSWTDLCSLN